MDEFRAAGYIAPALMNFLALLGWAPDGETTIMPPEELIRRFSLERVGASPATLDYEKLDWMNGVYLRAMPRRSTRTRSSRTCASRATTGPRSAFEPPRRSSRTRSSGSASSPSSPASSSAGRAGPGAARRRRGDARGRRGGAGRVEPFTAEAIEQALRALADRLGQKPRQAFQPIRVAVTGSKISPGLFESLELLGRDEALARISAARAVAA